VRRPKIKQQIVLWNLEDESQEDSASAVVGLRAAFERLVAKVPGLLNREIGISVSGIDYACDVILNS